MAKCGVVWLFKRGGFSVYYINSREVPCLTDCEFGGFKTWTCFVAWRFWKEAMGEWKVCLDCESFSLKCLCITFISMGNSLFPCLQMQISFISIFDHCGFHLLFRQAPSGAISGQHLGEAAHRLVVNSLQVKADRNGYGNRMHGPPHSYPVPPYRPQLPSYRNNQMPPPRPGHHPRGPPQYSNSIGQGYRDDRYKPPYVSSAPHHPNSRHQPQNYERNNRSVTHNSGEHSRSLYYPPSGGGQIAVPMFAGIPLAQTPNGVRAHPYQAGYNSSQNYQPPGASSQQHWLNGAPTANHSFPRGYSRPQQSGNQYSVLDKRGNKRPQPPPPGYGRK